MLLTWIISSATSLSSGLPRGRGTIVTRPRSPAPSPLQSTSNCNRCARRRACRAPQRACCASCHSARSSAVHGGSSGAGSRSRTLRSIVVEPQVGGDRHALEHASDGRTSAPSGADLDVERQRGRRRPLAQRQARRSTRSGSIVSLRPGMYTVDSRAPRDRVERRAAARSASAGAAMWMPISRWPLARLAHRERIVDLGRRRVVDRERAHRSRPADRAAAATAPTAGNAVPCGNASARKRLKW